MDMFKDHAQTLTAPAREALAVTPADATPLPALSRGIYAGQGGDLALTMAGGQTVVFRGLPAGSLLPVRASHIRASGTTAADIVALW